MSNRPSPGDSRIDSRDIIEAFDELTADLASKQEEVEELESELAILEEDPNEEDRDRVDMEEARNALKNAHEELADIEKELKPFADLVDECDGYGDWKYGETLILKDEFQDYAQELAEECDMVPKDLSWPCTCIDWEQAAAELKMDYMEVDFDGEAYFMRA